MVEKGDYRDINDREEKIVEPKKRVAKEDKLEYLKDLDENLEEDFEKKFAKK